MTYFRKTEEPLSTEEITAWLRDLRGNPYVPASGFDVTAVFKAKVGDGKNYYFAGVNVENPDHRSGTHGEEAAIAGMVTALGKHAEIEEGWVMGAPKELKVGDDHPLANSGVTCCGKCRQQVVGFAEGDVQIHSVSLNGAVTTTTVDEFLPERFTFRQFAPELLEVSQSVDIVPPSEEEAMRKIIRTGVELSDEEVYEWLDSLESADFATKQSQAVVMKLANGAYVGGVKIEEAAFVDISPIQAAAAIASAAFGEQKVLEVWTLGKGRDGAEIPEESHSGLSLASLQTLNQFATHRGIPLHLFNGKGHKVDVKLQDAVRYAPTFDDPHPEVGPERFIRGGG